MTTGSASMLSNLDNELATAISVKLGAGTAINIFATGICAAVVDVLSAGVGPAKRLAALICTGKLRL